MLWQSGLVIVSVLARCVRRVRVRTCSMMTIRRPDRSEAADYYFIYIDKVSTDNICAYLSDQGEQTTALLSTISEER
jgi:hypothetical protein